MGNEHSFDDIWRVEDHLSGPAAAVSRQIGYLSRSGAFDVIRELNMLSSDENVFERSALVVSDTIHFDEKVLLRNRLQQHLSPTNVEFSKRKKGYATMVLATLAYNIGFPRTATNGDITENTWDEIVFASFPNGVVVSHQTYLDGNRFHTEGRLFSGKPFEAQRDAMLDAARSILQENPPI